MERAEDNYKPGTVLEREGSHPEELYDLFQRVAATPVKVWLEQDEDKEALVDTGLEAAYLLRPGISLQKPEFEARVEQVEESRTEDFQDPYQGSPEYPRRLKASIEGFVSNAPESAALDEGGFQIDYRSQNLSRRDLKRLKNPQLSITRAYSLKENLDPSQLDSYALSTADQSNWAVHTGNSIEKERDGIEVSSLLESEGEGLQGQVRHLENGDTEVEIVTEDNPGKKAIGVFEEGKSGGIRKIRGEQIFPREEPLNPF